MMTEDENNRKEETNYTDEQGGGGIGVEKPLTKEEFFEQLDKVIKADPKKRRHRLKKVPKCRI